MDTHIWGRVNLFPSILAHMSHSNKPPLMGKSAKDKIPQVVLDAINVFDDSMNDARAEIVYMDYYWYVRAKLD
jgi:hypothetical protein